jgi:8-oxo-dGTP pyrophosphatase MutT (NUDIX family)
MDSLIRKKNMKKIKICHHDNSTSFTKEISRHAVRAIIENNNRLLLIFSSTVGDYKFPGGGIEKDESNEAALRREVQEECGVEVFEVKNMVLRIVEERISKECSTTKFKMISDYYICTSSEELGMQNLDPYEAELGFTPGWFDINDAVQCNNEIVNSTDADRIVPRWIKRDTMVLEMIKNRLIS